MGAAPRYTAEQKRGIGPNALAPAKCQELCKFKMGKARDLKAPFNDRGRNKRRTVRHEEPSTPSNLGWSSEHNERKKAASRANKPLLADGSRGKPRGDGLWYSKSGAIEFKQSNMLKAFNEMVCNNWVQTNQMGVPDEVFEVQILQNFYYQSILDEYGMTAATCPLPPFRVVSPSGDGSS